jgi:hypothetical protein
MLIPLDRSLLSRGFRLRALYSGPIEAENSALSPVVNEFKRLAVQLTPSFGRFTYSTNRSDTITRTGAEIANDLRVLVHFRDTLRTLGKAGDVVALLTAAIKNASFRLSKAALADRTVADLYDVAGWSEHLE